MEHQPWLQRYLLHHQPSFPSRPLHPSLSLLSTRPWDPLNDLIQFEKDGCIQTKVRHRTPMVRSGSLISLSNQGPRRDNCKCQVGMPENNATPIHPWLPPLPPPPPLPSSTPLHQPHCHCWTCFFFGCHFSSVLLSCPCMCTSACFQGITEATSDASVRFRFPCHPPVWQASPSCW